MATSARPPEGYSGGYQVDEAGQLGGAELPEVGGEALPHHPREVLGIEGATIATIAP